MQVILVSDPKYGRVQKFSTVCNTDLLQMEKTNRTHFPLRSTNKEILCLHAKSPVLVSGSCLVSLSHATELKY